MSRTLAGVVTLLALLAPSLAAQKNVRQPSATAAPSGPTRAAGADATAGTWSNGQLTITLQRRSGLHRRGDDVSGSGSRCACRRRAALASSAQDRQIAQLLLSSRWCSFSYSQVSGTTRTEQVTFGQDGSMSVGSQRESQSSNQYGSVYGSSSGGERYRWRIQNGMLMTTQDGANWSQTPLQITRNSNGYPIVNADGKE